MSRRKKNRIVTSKPPVTVTAHQTVVERHARFKGPIPHPDALAEYDRILPGLADRIMTMAEAESLHRREHEAKQLTGQIEDKHAERKERRRGQVFGLVIALGVLVSATSLAVYGYELAGSILGAAGMTGVVSVFVYGRRAGKVEERDLQTSGD